jgi:hypothetical protein
MVAELARVRFFVEALKSGDSSYPKISTGQTTGKYSMNLRTGRPTKASLHFNRLNHSDFRVAWTHRL